MTTLMTREQAPMWTPAPGWSVVADLMPPEVLASRRLRVVRTRIVGALAVLLAGCLAAYGLALVNHSSAQASLLKVQDQTTFLKVQQRSFGEVTQAQTQLSLTQKQIATLMAGDVAVSAFVTKVRAALPAALTIKNLSVDLTAASLTTGATGTRSGLNVSGRPIIGSVILSGSALTYQDVARYVDTLVLMPGVTDVMLTSAQADQSGVQYNITLNLTDSLLSKRFVPAEGGGR